MENVLHRSSYNGNADRSLITTMLLSEYATTGTRFDYVHIFLTVHFNVLLLITNVKNRAKAHLLGLLTSAHMSNTQSSLMISRFQKRQQSLKQHC